MRHLRKALVPVLLLAFSLSASSGWPQSAGQASDLKDGIDQFRNGQYDKAILLFHSVILDPNVGAQKQAAYLLIAKSYMAIGKLDEAEHNLEFYLATYPGAAEYEEALYQKGRLLFMQDDFESSIQALQSFISTYPRSTFVPSALFWVAESLYGLGRLDDSLAVYQKIISEYPTSAKVEASQYRISLVQLRKKEVELAKLLKWSHEEFLRSIEEYQNRERAYEQAIAAYQKRLAGSGSDEDRKTIAELQQQLARKPAQTPTTPSSASEEIARMQRLLAAKQAALALKEQYLLRIESSGGGGTGK